MCGLELICENPATRGERKFFFFSVCFSHVQSSVSKVKCLTCGANATEVT